MAFLNLKKNKKSEPVEEKKAKTADSDKKEAVKASSEKSVYVPQTLNVISRPRVTEKASHNQESNIYTFDITTEGTKTTVAKEIKRMYGVTPLKIRVVRVPGKIKMSRGKLGKRKGGKKAYVMLRKGDKIDLM